MDDVGEQVEDRAAEALRVGTALDAQRLAEHLLQAVLGHERQPESGAQRCGDRATCRQPAAPLRRRATGSSAGICGCDALIARAILAHMPLWALTIVICSIVWIVGTIFVVVGATWLVRHEPH